MWGQKKISSICIPHGTLSAPFNKFDKIYKNIIAEAISIDQSEFIAAQSKISKSFFKSNNYSGNTIDTGNLIFPLAKTKTLSATAKTSLISELTKIIEIPFWDNFFII